MQNIFRQVVIQEGRRFPVKLVGLVLALLLLSNRITKGQSDIYRSLTTKDGKQIRAGLDTALVKSYAIAKQNPDEGLRQLVAIYQESERIQYAYGVVRALLQCSNVYLKIRNDNEVDQVLFYLRKARPYLKEAGLRDGRIVEEWLTSMGATFARSGEMDSAMYYLVAGLNAALRQNRGGRELAQRYINIAAVYFELRQFDKVIQYTRQAEQTAIAEKLYPQLHATYMIIAETYMETGNLDSALHYLSLSSAVAYEPMEYDRRWFQEVEGGICLKKGMPQEALLHFKKAIAIEESPTGLMGLGKTYQLLQQYPLAEKYLLKAREAVIKLKSGPGFLIDVTNELARLYDSMGNYKAAYVFRTKAYDLQTEMNDKTKVEIINKLESRYRNAEKVKQLAEKQVQLLAARSQVNKQYIWIAGVAILALLALISIVALYQKQKLQRNKAKNQQQFQEIEKLRAEIEAEERERSRIGRQLHDDIMVQLSIVKMNMEALSFPDASVHDLDSFQSIKDQLDMAGRDLRQTAHNLAPDTLLADGLTQALLYFCKNVQYRTSLVINFQYYGDTPEVSQEVEINVYRISQELIQNIIKHAHAANVLIQLSYREDMLTLTIEDDGIGFDMDPDVPGIGLKSIRSRLKVMNGQIDIHRRHPQGTSVTIEVYK